MSINSGLKQKCCRFMRRLSNGTAPGHAQITYPSCPKCSVEGLEVSTCGKPSIRCKQSGTGAQRPHKLTA